MGLGVAIDGDICARWRTDKLIWNYEGGKDEEMSAASNDDYKNSPQIIGETLFEQTNREEDEEG